MRDFLKHIVPIPFINYLKRVLIYFPLENGKAYNGKILHRYKNNQSKYRNLCIFYHFDKDNVIDDYVIYYLQELSEQNFDIVFVSTAEELSPLEIDKIKHLCRDILVKENIGYDFGAWQTAIVYLAEDLYKYDTLLLCNDSVYAPLYPLEEMFQKMQGRYDFWGITDSYEIYHHLQSYFMVFDKKVVESKVFQDIWKTYKVYKIKRNIILQYEIGLSRKFLKAGYSMGVYCSYDKLNTTLIRNASHYSWRELLEKFRCPILKVELLRDNPKNINTLGWEELIKNTSSYDIGMIQRHLKRMDY